jgi:hypothetical protein
MEDQDFIPTLLELYDVLMTLYTDIVSISKILTENNKELISSEEIQSFNRLHIKSLVSSIEGSVKIRSPIAIASIPKSSSSLLVSGVSIPLK